ncbi:MAG TPA: hypothetical protein VGR78_06460 [Verrucomicrobiae bacterium]|jgi:hypothetical protein|nr:hypothetical protein [Verrucomicrobiae bacterium]
MFDPKAINDPRLSTDFDPALFPLCDGGEAPPVGTDERIARRKIEFLAVYYRLNQLYSLLSAIRNGKSSGDEKEVLQEIQRAIRARDLLEDFYESEGFLGEPVMDGFFYKDIEFTYARRREFYQPAASSSFSLFIPMPPPDSNIEEWIREHLAKSMSGKIDVPPA